MVQTQDKPRDHQNTLPREGPIPHDPTPLHTHVYKNFKPLFAGSQCGCHKQLESVGQPFYPIILISLSPPSFLIPSPSHPIFSIHPHNQLHSFLSFLSLF